MMSYSERTARAEAGPVDAVAAANGCLSLRADGREIAAIHVAVELEGGRVLFQSGAQAAADDPSIAPPTRRARMGLAGGARVDIETRAEPVPGGLKLTYRITPASGANVTGSALSVELPAALWRGAKWTGDDNQGEIPEDFTGRDEAFTAEAASLRLVALRPAGAATNRLGLALRTAEPTSFVCLDDRKWQDHFTLRVDLPENPSEAGGKTRSYTITLGMEGPVKLVFDEPVTLKAGDEWVPLQARFDSAHRKRFEIEPGSALDFSQMGLTDAPAGKHGFVRAVGDHFEFHKAPGRPVRFYGVNFCYGALYLDHAQTDRVADRLARTGYNSVRIHHYERDLVDPDAPDSLTFRPDALDKLDYFVAAMKKRGLYLTTDLFVSRPVRAAEVFPGQAGRLRGHQYKMLVLVNERALANLQEFARRLLTHVNPYTGLAWKDDPAIATLSLINEGMVLNFCDRQDDRTRPAWQAAFNRWLVSTYGDRSGLAQAWGEELAPEHDPAKGTVPLPSTFGVNPAGLDFARFASRAQADFYLRMKRFLRDELGCRALLTDMNGWTEIPQSQFPRSLFDYVDAHFYWDHPIFLRDGWRLPSRGWSGGGSAVAADGSGPRERAFLRLFGRPFTVSEYNYVGPNKWRAEAGLLLGSFAAIQDWAGVWRYSYAAHRRDASILFKPAPLGYFDMMCDPLNQATERAVISLYLRGDASAAPARVAIRASRQELLGSRRINRLSPDLSRLGWVARVGLSLSDLADPQGEPEVQLPLSGVVPKNSGGAMLDADPFSARAVKPVLKELRDRKLLPADNPTDPDKGLFVSQTGQVRLDSEAALLTVNTPRTAGLFSRTPRQAQAGPLRAELQGCGGAVWVTSLDGKPISESRRMLLVHVTDLQNTGARFADRDRLILEQQGTVPYIVRVGTARVSLATSQAGSLKVWALDTSGRRISEVDSAVADEALRFKACTRGPRGACFYYEVGPE